jgi:uncharacterized protein (TIGR03437 family)
MTKLLPLAGLLLVFLAAPAVHAQTIGVDRQSLVFTAQTGGPPTSLAVNVSSSPSSAIVLTTVVEQTDTAMTWLSVSPAGGQTPLGLAVTVNPSGLSVGTYNGSIVISVFGGSSSVTVGVTLTVSSILVSPTSISFQTSLGNTPLVQSVTLGASTTVTFNATVATTSGGNWLTVTPTSGAILGYGAVTAVPDPTVVPTLSPGTYNGTITITPTSGTSTTPVSIPVTLTVTPAPAITVNPAALSLQYQIGGSNNDAQQTVTLSTPSGEAIPFTASATNQPTPIGGTWVLVNPTSGNVNAAGTPVQVSYVSAANLPTGTWTGTVTVSTPTGSPASTDIPVTLVISSQPLINVPGSTLAFNAELNASTPPAQSVNITSTSGALPYTVAAVTTDGATWLVAPASGTTPGPLAISVDPTGLAPGTYTGTVTVTGTGAGNGPQKIPVTLKVSNDPSLVSNFTSLALPYQIGQTQAVTQSIALSSSTGAPLTYSATATTTSCGTGWLALSGSNGTTTGQVTLAVNGEGLMAGTCSADLSIAATNTATGAAALNSGLKIPVTLTVSASALLVATPLNPAVFTAQTGTASQGAHVYTLTSSDSDVLNYSVQAATANGSGNWLNISQTTGNTASGFNSLAILAQPGQLTPGIYTGTVTVTATGPGGATVDNSPLTIPVIFNITNGALVLNQSSLKFQQSLGGAAPIRQTVNITSTGAVLGFAAAAYTSGSTPWLTVTQSGLTPGSISIGADGGSLPLGTYTGTVTVVSTTPNAGNSPVSIPVTLTVNAGTISAGATSLIFTEALGGSPLSAQTLTISGSPGAIPFQVSATTADGSRWLQVTPTSASTPDSLQVSVAANSLAIGTYSGDITITAPGAEGSPLAVPVTLNVVTPHNLTADQTVETFMANPGSIAVQSATVQLSSAGGSVPFSATAAGGPWLSVSPTSGNTPAAVTVAVDPTGLAAGSYSGTITFGSPSAVSQVTVTVNLVVGTVARPEVNAIANAASYFVGSFAPGENIVIFGSGIGPAQLTKGTVTNGIVDTTLAATRVLFDGIPAPIIYALSAQTSVIVPYELSGRATANVVVEYQGVQSVGIAYSVVESAPGIYAQNAQGNGPGAILNQDYSINLPVRPADKGSVVSVYMTGEGDTFGAVDGAIATGLLSPLLPVAATVGGIQAQVKYAGTAPGIVTGAMQVNVQIPATAPSGSAVPLVIVVGTGETAVATQIGITIAIK